MKTKHRPILTEAQQALLEGVQVRLIQPEERKRFDQVITESHYLHSAEFVGEQLRYVAEYQGQWVALLVWSAAAYKLKLREQWIGWSDRQKRRRLPLVVNHSRFFIPEPFHIPNLASRVMKLNLERLSLDWEQAYHHAVLIAETFVDPERFRGTTYKASGWTLLGHTQGFQRSRADFYEPHDKPKQLWVRELQPGVRTILRGRNLPAACQACEQESPPECVQSPEELQQMEIFFGDLPDWRQRQHSIDFPLSSLVAVTVCAMLCKVCLGQRDLAAFALNLTRDQMKALGFPRDWSSRIHRYIPPSESTFARMLRHLENKALQHALLRWLDHLLGKRNPVGDQVSVDGKELLNSQGLKVASAYSVTQGRWLGSEAVAKGSNEIPAVQAVLRRVDLDGSLVTADALNTQTETARIVVQEKGGDYLFTVKGNQPGVAKNVQQLYSSLSRAFSPSGQNFHRPDF
ncbi:MAG TPA: ISAs1 family transposase [Candidatus Eisenbacteria bacterium]|nr:ISAs1 family transposase [Candidatus Eisenbacteria bacterium]